MSAHRRRPSRQKSLEDFVGYDYPTVGTGLSPLAPTIANSDIEPLRDHSREAVSDGLSSPLAQVPPVLVRAEHPDQTAEPGIFTLSTLATR